MTIPGGACMSVAYRCVNKTSSPEGNDRSPESKQIYLNNLFFLTFIHFSLQPKQCNKLDLFMHECDQL